MVRPCPKKPHPCHAQASSVCRGRSGSPHAWVGCIGQSVLTGGPGRPLPCKTKPVVRVRVRSALPPPRQFRWVLEGTLPRVHSPDRSQGGVPSPEPQGQIWVPGDHCCGQTCCLLRPKERRGWYSPPAQAALGVPGFPEKKSRCQGALGKELHLFSTGAPPQSGPASPPRGSRCRSPTNR